MLLSIVVPTYNEEMKIQKDIEQIYGYFTSQNYSFEVIVVNDGSTDRTFEKVKSIQKYYTNLHIVSYPKNRGKGYAVKTGILQSRGKNIMFVDAGGCVPFDESEKALRFLQNGYDIAIGSRLLQQSKLIKRQPIYRTISGNCFSFILRNFLKVRNIKDTQCGFKVFRRAIAQDIFSKLKTNGFTFDVEVLLRATQLGYAIKEFPIQWACDHDSRLSPFRHSLGILIQLIKIKFIR